MSGSASRITLTTSAKLVCSPPYQMLKLITFKVIGSAWAAEARTYPIADAATHPMAALHIAPTRFRMPFPPSILNDRSINMDRRVR
jgi:hypothetical protein